MDLMSLTAVELGKKIQAKEVTVEEAVKAAAAGIEHLAADGQNQLVIGMAVDDGADVLFVRIPADHHAGTGQHLARLILSQLRIDIMRDCVNHANPLPWYVVAGLNPL